MKHLLALLVLTFSTLCFSQTVFLNSTDIQDLNLDQTEIEIGVSYPGPELSGVCGVEIRSDANMVEVKKLIKIETALGIDPVVRAVRNNIILVDLTKASNMYMTSFKISTNDGKTFKENFGELLIHGEKIMLVTRTCP